MGRNIVVAIVVIVLVVCGVYAYQHYRLQHQQETGDITWVTGKPDPAEQARFLKENSGDTPDGQSEHKERTARQEETAGFPDAVPTGQPAPTAQAPAAQTSSSQTTSSQTTLAPTTPMAAAPTAADPFGTSNPASAPRVYPAPTPVAQVSYPTGSGFGTPMQTGMAVGETLSPNAPNGMRFGGRGTYEWYRQGNLTWRIDTVSGRSCIMYATMEEWQKQIVYSHGCGRNA